VRGRGPKIRGRQSTVSPSGGRYEGEAGTTLLSRVFLECGARERRFGSHAKRKLHAALGIVSAGGHPKLRRDRSTPRRATPATGAVRPAPLIARRAAFEWRGLRRRTAAAPDKANLKPARFTRHPRTALGCTARPFGRRRFLPLGAVHEERPAWGAERFESGPRAAVGGVIIERGGLGSQPRRQTIRPLPVS